MRVVLDRALRCPSHARILQPPGLTHLVYDPVRAKARDIARLEGLATLWPWPGTAAGETEWDALWRLLASHAINEVHVEAGATLSGAMVAAHAVVYALMLAAWVAIGRGALAGALPAATPGRDRRARRRATAGRARKRSREAACHGARPETPEAEPDAVHDR